MTENSRSFSISGMTLLWLFAVVSLFLYLGHNALWGSEDRWAEIAREMLVTGDYLHPAVNWRIYFDKPQLSYWFILPWMVLLGSCELAARIPSALAALAGLYGTVMLARQAFDRKTALLAGWILVSCYGFIFWGRTAAADMANMTFSVLAVSWFYYARKTPCFWKYLVFYLILFTGALTKGVPAILVPAAFLLPGVLREKELVKNLRFSNFFALLTGAALYLLPFYLAAMIKPASGLLLPEGPVLSGLELVWKENIVRAFNAFDHKDPVYSYLYHLPRLLLPWSILFVPMVIFAAFKRKELSSAQKNFFLGIVLIFLMFTASTSRRWYYMLPIVPFCCIFLASLLYQYTDLAWLGKLIRFCRTLMMISGALAFVSPISLVLFHMKRIYPPLPAVLAVSIGGALILLVMTLDNAPGSRIEKLSGVPHKLASLTLSFGLFAAVLFSVVLPSCTVYRSEKPFLLGIKDRISAIPAEQIMFFGTDSAAKCQFYLQWHGPTAVVWKNTGGVKKFMEKNAGKEVLIFCYHRKRELGPLFAELSACGIDTRDLKAEFREPGKGKKWGVFKLYAPEAEKENNLKNKE